MSGELEGWDEDSDESSENQDSLCMILAEEKTRHHDRELQTDPIIRNVQSGDTGDTRW